MRRTHLAKPRPAQRLSVMKNQPREVVAEALAAKRELRAVPSSAFSLRKAADGTYTLTGHASVFDTAYDIWGGPPFGWTETMDAGAFDKTLREKPDVQLLINHDGMPLARTKSGTLRLATDSVGLAVEADLEPRSTTVGELALAMDRGDIDEMSFAFRVLRQEWNEEYTERKVLEVSIHRGDVSVVNYGANPATSATLRARALADMATMSPEKILAEVRGARGVDLAALSAARDNLGQALADKPTTRAATGDPDEDAGALAQAVDAVLDELSDALDAEDLPTATALCTAAEATIDTLLEVLGVDDADDSDDEASSRAAKPPAPSSVDGIDLAEARRQLDELNTAV